MDLVDQQWCPTSVQVTVLQAKGLRTKGKNGTNDAYAVMQLGKEKYQTSVVEKTVAPVWKEEASFDLPQQLRSAGDAARKLLHIQVLHRALVGPDKLLGQAVLNLPELSEDQTRNKTEWFKLLDKTGKPDKDRGEVLVDVQFMRNNMTASMFDLSAAGKSRSRLGKLKDKVRGKKKESDSASSLAPAFSQVLTDSEEEEAKAGNDGKFKKPKMKTLFSPKSNLQRNMSQSMSVLPAKNSSLSGSQSALNVDSSEGKKKFKFKILKRSGSSESKDSSSGHQRQVPAEQSNLCINGSHIYCEEPPPRTSRASSAYSLTSSGLGSMEDVPENSPSINSLRGAKQYSSWMEEEEYEEPKQENDDDDAKREDEEERQRMEEERRRRVEEETAQRQKELENLAKEKLRQEEELKKLKEKRRREEEERIREEEVKKKKEEEERRLEEERAEQRRLEEEELRMKEKARLEEERRKVEEKAEEERKRKEAEEVKRMEAQKRREEEEERLRQEEVQRQEEQARREKEAEEEKKLEEEKKRIEAEEEQIRMQEEMKREENERRAREKELEEKRKKEEEEEEEERQRAEEEKKQRENERIRKENQEREILRQKELEKLRQEEEKKKMEEERIRREEEKRRMEKEVLRRQEEERKRLAEEMLRQEEERKKLEMVQREEELRRQEEMRHKEEKEAAERLALEMKRQEQEKQRIEEAKRAEEERIRQEEREKTEAKKLQKEILTDGEKPEQTENGTNDGERERENKPKVTSTKSSDEPALCNLSLEITSSSAPHIKSEDDIQERRQSSVSAVGSSAVSPDEKDPVGTQREKRPAPRPPRSTQAERERKGQQDVSEIKQDKAVKTVNVLPQRFIQIITPQSSSTDSEYTPGVTQSDETKITSARNSKRPAPSRPRSVEEQSTECKEADSETKQSSYGLNPFEDDEDENEVTVPVSGPIQWPPVVSQNGEKNAFSQAKVKSSKIAHAPPPPAKNDTASKKDYGNHITDTAASTTIPKETQQPQSESRNGLGQNKELQQNKARQISGGIKEGPSSSRRLLPVKPLNPPEQPSASLQVENDKFTGNLNGDCNKSKVECGPAGPYSQLTREELILLLVKQESQLVQKNKKISELEQYIDDLLVRVMEQQPSILMSMSSLKKA